MPRFQIALALLVSIVLVVSASAIRFTRSSSASPDVISVVNSPIENSLMNTLSDFTLTEAGSEVSLTQTDIISRQFFSDYLDLKSGEQATQENLINLANQYAESLIKERATTPVTRQQIKIISNTNDNLQNYGYKIAALTARYRASTGITKYNEGQLDVFGEEFIKLMALISLQYKLAAEELLSIEVPASLSNNHLALINNYLLSSQRMGAIAQISEDPISALVAMSDQSKNAEIEEGLIANIRIELISKGLSSNL